MSGFEDHPQSVSEIKANKSHDCSAWTPRDALIDLLRDIDGGKVRLDALVIAYRENDDEGKRTRFSMAAPDSSVGLGLLSRAAWMINEG